MSYGITRVTTHPVPSTITERRQIAQQIRNEMSTYRAINSGYASERRDQCLNRVAALWHRLLGLEGCTDGPRP